MKTKLIIGVLGLMLLLTAFGCYVFSHSAYPEKAIIGEWKEVSWTYDKVDLDDKVKQPVSDNDRYTIANHLVIHKFENWTFGKDYKVKLHRQHRDEHFAKWQLKDRGRILQLINPDGSTEVYSVQKLKNSELVLHFETDTHVRGIVKITLKKVT